jgi:hypothetical protein
MIPPFCCDLGTFCVCVCVLKSPYHHYQTASTSVYHRAQLDLIQDFTLPSLDHNFQYIYFNQKPSLQVTTNAQFCVDICGWTMTPEHEYPSMWCRKSHINLCSSIHTLMLKSAVGSLYIIHDSWGTKEELTLVTYMSWESLWCFVGEPHSFLASFEICCTSTYIFAELS